MSTLLVLASINIFMQWKRKLRMIKFLLKRNENDFDKESFRPYMGTFCSQIVVIYVLFKIGHINKLRILYSEFCKTFFKN